MTDEINFLNKISNAQFKNGIKELWRNPQLRFFLILMSIMITVQIFVFFQIGDSADDEEIEKESFYVLFHIFFILISFKSILVGSMSIMLRVPEIDFLLSKPISKRSIILSRLLMMYLSFFIIITCLTAFLFFIGRSNNLLIGSECIKFFYVSLTMSFTFIGIIAVALYSYLNISSSRKQRLIQYIFLIIIILIIFEGIYLFKSAIELQEDFNFIEQVLFLPPLNILLYLPLSSLYLFMTKTHDLTFWIILIFNGLVFTFVFHKSLNYNYNYYEDFGAIQTAQDQSFERELKPQASWWRRGFLKDTILKYPHLKKGHGAIMEIGFLFSIRTYLFLVIIVLVIFIVMLNMFSSVPSDENIIHLISFMSLYTFILVTLLGSHISKDNYRHYIFRQLPIKGLKFLTYRIIPFAAFSIIVYYFWLFLLISYGWLKDIDVILTYFWMGGILLIISAVASQTGFLIFSSENDMAEEKPSLGGIAGGILLFVLSMVFALFLYSHISLIIDTAWKFLYIGLALIGVIILLIFISGYDYDNFTRKKKRRYIRVILAILIIILIRGTTYGYPIFEFIPMPTYGPDSWQLKVDDVELIENEQITFNDYLYIVSTGVLTIRNSTIIFECTEEYRFGIYLDSGGKLRVENSTIYSNSSKYGFECYIYGRADFIKSNIYNLYGYYGNDYNYGGIYYYEARGEIIDCRISNSKTNGIDCYSSNIKIINTTIRNCNDDGIEIDDSNCKIYDCIIENNLGNGIYIIEASPEIYNCVISNNAGYGIYVDGGTPDLENNIIENNEKGSINI